MNTDHSKEEASVGGGGAGGGFKIHSLDLD